MINNASLSFWQSAWIFSYSWGMRKENRLIDMAYICISLSRSSSPPLSFLPPSLSLLLRSLHSGHVCKYVRPTTLPELLCWCTSSRILRRSDDFLFFLLLPSRRGRGEERQEKRQRRRQGGVDQEGRGKCLLRGLLLSNCFATLMKEFIFLFVRFLNFYIRVFLWSCWGW